MQRNEYIEKVGLFYADLGLSRMSGRILGCLMASSKESLSFEEIKTQLDASKGSISGNINILLAQGFIDRETKPGDRKTYYRFSDNCVYRLFHSKFNQIMEMRNLLILANEINTPAVDKHGRINKMIGFYNYLEQELPKMVERWKKQQK